jgi:flavoprotein
MEQKNKNIYVIVTGCAKIRELPEMVAMIQKFIKKVTIYIVPTPIAREAVDKLGLKKVKILNEHSSLINTSEKNPEADLVLVAPASFNSVAKIANGIADNRAMTLVATAIAGGVPTIIAPSYDTMWQHPRSIEYIRYLESVENITVVWPDLTRDHITMTSHQKVIDSVLFRLKTIKYCYNKIDDSVDGLDDLVKSVVCDVRDIFLKKKTQSNQGVSGCLSVGLKNGRVLVSATGAKINQLKENDLVVVERDGDTIKYYGERMPSSDAPMHLEIHKKCPKANVVLHLHRTAVTYGDDFADMKTKEYIPYGEFGVLDELVEKLQQDDYAILKLHGEVVIGSDFEDVYRKLPDEK